MSTNARVLVFARFHSFELKVCNTTWEIKFRREASANGDRVDEKPGCRFDVR